MGVGVRLGIGLEKALKVVRRTVVLQPSHAAALWGFYRSVIPYNKQNGRHVHMQLSHPQCKWCHVKSQEWTGTPPTHTRTTTTTTTSPPASEPSAALPYAGMPPTARQRQTSIHAAAAYITHLAPQEHAVAALALPPSPPAPEQNGNRKSCPLSTHPGTLL